MHGLLYHSYIAEEHLNVIGS